jgi:hypothetical protein
MPSDTLQVIFQHGLVGQSYSLLDYKETFRYDHARGIVNTVAEQTEVSIKQGQQRQVREFVSGECLAPQSA